MIRVVVADDQQLVRDGLCLLLSALDDIVVVGSAADGREAIDLARDGAADVVLMDLRMPRMDGVEATRRLVTRDSSSDALIKVLALSTFNDDDSVYRAIRAGASGFLVKDAASADLARAVRAVARGDYWLDQTAAGPVIRSLQSAWELAPASEGLTSVLTPRECEVLALVAHGLSNTEIADHLVLSEATVKTHVSRILLKSGSRDRAQAVVQAYQSGLVRPGVLRATPGPDRRP